VCVDESGERKGDLYVLQIFISSPISGSRRPSFFKLQSLSQYKGVHHPSSLPITGPLVPIPVGKTMHFR
jgi:hypothetical protein